MKKFLLLVIVITSCAPVYIPNMRNSPMFKKAGEFQASGSVGNGFDVQGALAITDHIGIMGNYAYINRNNNADDYLRHNFFEGGLGYFENQDKMFLELFAGYGKGDAQSSNYYFSGFKGAKGKYERYFIQPAIGFNNKAMHVSFINRVSIVDFTEFNTGTSTLTVREHPVVFFEPAVLGRLNSMSNHLFFTYQIGAAIPTENPYFDYRAWQMSTGIGFRFGGIKSEEKKVNR